MQSSSSDNIDRTEATIDNVHCSGSESQLIDCSHDVGDAYIGSVPRVECQYCKYKQALAIVFYQVNTLVQLVMGKICLSGHHIA